MAGALFSHTLSEETRILHCLVLLRWNILPETRNITSEAENIFAMSLMTQLTLTLNDPHYDA